MNYKEIQFNLFHVDPRYTLVHCISLDCEMGAGIALEFRNRYPKMKESLLECIKENETNYPTAILYKTSLEENDVINMITKEKYFHKPTLRDFSKALDDVVKICTLYKINKLAMPIIGCGLDKLKWTDVKALILTKFKDIDIDILVCKN